MGIEKSRRLDGMFPIGNERSAFERVAETGPPGGDDGENGEDGEDGEQTALS